MTSQSTPPEILSTLGPLEEKFIFVSLGIPVVSGDQDFSYIIFKFCFSKPFHRYFDDVTTLCEKVFRFLGNVTKPLKYFNILQRPYARWSIS